MEVNVLPTAVLFVPHSSLFDRATRGDSGSIGRLRQANVAHDRCVTHHSDLGTCQSCLNFASGCFGQFEIELMKIHSFDQLAERLGLEASQTRIAQFAVRGPVAMHDTF